MTQVFHTEGVPPIRGNSTLAANGSIANNSPALAPTARIAARGIRPVVRSWVLVTWRSVQLFVGQVNGPRGRRPVSQRGTEVTVRGRRSPAGTEVTRAGTEV